MYPLPRVLRLGHVVLFKAWFSVYSDYKSGFDSTTRIPHIQSNIIYLLDLTVRSILSPKHHRCFLFCACQSVPTDPPVTRTSFSAASVQPIHLLLFLLEFVLFFYAYYHHCSKIVAMTRGCVVVVQWLCRVGTFSTVSKARPEDPSGPARTVILLNRTSYIHRLTHLASIYPQVESMDEDLATRCILNAYPPAHCATIYPLERPTDPRIRPPWH